ncbi:Oidioi.mRNA.OKI2018_I69.chr1.g2317.t1.cds [Oikopleura dioica]|uniref:Mitochondrial inner membrane protease subunit 2 n=1 Tax=Oikopleura dioica TaxID=34765 RepID=A0ABN7SX36_OIKDI|nr:Oidioi.mRNA.OKI2018_I69.chr1.g2317.t1.cds [Oikopleura dioica]
MVQFDCEILNSVCSSDQQCSENMKEIFKCKNCESSIHEKHKCHSLQESILIYVNAQLSKSKGVRALDCFCNIKDTTSGCRLKQKLKNNFYDCHLLSTPDDTQCQQLYSTCSENAFNSICGQSLLKLATNCSVPKNGECDKNNCIQSIGDLIFNDFDPKQAALFFKCCEYEHKCSGLPWTIYSPKACLDRSPLYSCTYSYYSCIEDPECAKDIQTIEDKCHEDFLHHNKTTCDRDWHNPATKDVEECLLATQRLEHYFCSCELNETLPYEEGIAELDECLKYRRLFTVQPCFEQIIDLPEEKGRHIEDIQPVSWIIFYSLLGISCCIIILCCFAKPPLRSRRSSFRRSRLQVPEHIAMRSNSRNSSLSLFPPRNESSDSFSSRLTPRYETISIWERLMIITKSYFPKKFRKIAKLFGIHEEHLEFFYENRKRFTWNIKEKPKVHYTEQHCKYSAEFEGHSLDDHMIEAHNYRDIQCKEPNCSYLAYSPKSIAQHKSRFHGTGSRNSNLRFDFKCRYSNCNFSAKCVFLLDSHYKIHENRLVACICCQFRTSDPKSMKNHMMSHFNLQSLECEICKRKFNTPSAIRTHERYRHAEMQKCEDCGATFKTSGSFRKHSNGGNNAFVLLSLDRDATRHGDIVSSRDPQSPQENVCKRVIALGGDRIRDRKNQREIEIPEGFCWLEGDNEACSIDSNEFGPDHWSTRTNRYQNEQKEKAKKRKHSVKADEALNTVTLETANYLSKLPAAQQTKEGIVEFVQKLKADDDGAKLLPNELMQIVNLRPQQPVELYLLIEDIEGRISEENVDKLQELVQQ